MSQADFDYVNVLKKKSVINEHYWPKLHFS